MHRIRVPLRSVAGSLYRSKPHEHGQKKVAEKLESLRTLTTREGCDDLECGVESITRSIHLQIVDLLRSGERSKASSLLSDVSQGYHCLTANDFVYILNYCARSPDPLFILENWRILEKNNIIMNNKCSLFMVKALCEGGYLDEAVDLINFLGENRAYPALPIYNCFLRASAIMRSTIHANKCLDMMECKVVGKNEVTYSVLLKLAVWQQNLFAVQEIWKEYVKNYSLSILSLSKFIRSFSRLGDLKAAYQTLQQMVGLALRGNTFVHRTSERKLTFSRLDIPIPSRSENYSMKLDLEVNEHSPPGAYSEKLSTCASPIEQCTFSCMEHGEDANGRLHLLNKYKNNPVMKVLTWSFSDVIHGCAHVKNSSLAEQLMLQMQNLGLQPSGHTYNGFLRAVIAERGFTAGMDVLKMMQQRNLKPYDSNLAALSICCSKMLELDLAEALLLQVSSCPSLRPFNAFLAACDTTDQPERATRMLAKMRKLKLKSDIRTYELLFSLFGNVNVPYEDGNLLSQVDAAKRIHALEMDMVRNGVQHSHLSMMNLLKALGAEGMIRELLQYLHVAENLFFRNNSNLEVPIYNSVLHSLVEAKESHVAIKIFKEMKSSGILPDAATYNIMIDCCCILTCFKSACGLLSLMIREGFSPQALTYTSLIKIVLEYENFVEALTLLDQATSEGIQLDVILFNTILRKAREKGRIDIIEFIVERMHREKIQPDPSTCHHVFSAYVNQGFHSTAVEALQVLSMRMLSKDGALFDKTEYEDEFILAEDLEAESRILNFFKDSDENLAVALLNLRWSAMTGFLVPLSPDQSPWARRLSNSYGYHGRAPSYT